MKAKLCWLFFVLVSIFHSCEKHNDDPIEKSFSPDIESSLTNSYANSPTYFKLKVGDIGKYKLQYTNSSGSGDLFIGSRQINNNTPTELSISELDLSYFPHTLGEHRLQFQLSNTNHSTEIVYAVSVSDYSTSISPQGSNENIYAGQPIYIDFSLIEKGSNTAFLATIDVLKGDGNAVLIENPITARLKRDSVYIHPFIIGDSLPSLPVTKSNNVYKLTPGLNRIYYLPTVSGEHLLRLNLTNSYNYKQSFDLKLTALIPDFSATAENDTTIILGHRGNFIMQINNPVRTDELHTSFRFIKNSGKVIFNGNSISENNVFTILAGAYKGTYEPTSKGKAAIEFIIKDQYNQTKKGTMLFDVVEPAINVSIDIPEKIYNDQATVIPFSINENGYSGKFNCKMLTEPQNSGIFKINGITETEYLLDGGQYNIEFTPNISGRIKISAIISDNMGNSTSKSVEMDILENVHKIAVKEYNPIVSVTESRIVQFDIIKNNYTGKYMCKIDKTPAGNSKIKINGKEYTSGKISVNKSNNLEFIPSLKGEHSLVLEVTTDDEKTMRENLSFTATEGELAFNVSGYKKEVQTGKETTLNFSVKKEGYIGSFKYKIIQEPAGSGTVKINGETYFSETLETLNNNTSVSISFIPKKSGASTLTLHVYDGLKETLFPFTFEANTPPIQTAIKGFNPSARIGVENTCIINVSKADYSSSYKCSISTTPVNAGKIKINNLSNLNNLFDISSGETSLVFTPAITGNINLNLLIEDVFGGIVNKTFEYQVLQTFPALQVIGSIDESININTGGKFSISVKKEGYKGKYFLEASGNGYKSMKISNILYDGKTEILDPENIVVSFFPSGINPVRINIKVTDEEGGSVEKTFSFTVNESDINLTLNGFPDISEMQTGSFSFYCSKPNYSGKLQYQFEIIPANAGNISIGGKPYQVGTILEMNADEKISPIFKAQRSGSASIKVIVKEGSNEKSKLFSFNVLPIPIKIDFSNLHSASTIHTENFCYVSIKGESYTGKYKCNITLSPPYSGSILIDDIPYTGMQELQNPENTKITFVPSLIGNVTATLNISNEYGTTETRKIEYNVSNPDIEILSDESGSGIVNKEQTFRFSVNKSGYTGRYSCEIAGNDINKIQINGGNYLGGKINIPSGNSTLKFTPSKTGDLPIRIKISDEWGITKEKTVKFSIEDTETAVTITPGQSSLYEGDKTAFIFALTKDYADSVDYDISVSPSNAGIVSPTNGKAKNGMPVHVNFTALNAGTATVTVRSGNAEKSTFFKIEKSSSNINMSDFSGSSYMDVTNTCKFSISKPGYTGTFKVRLSLQPANAGKIKINGSEYKEGMNLPGTTNILEFTPAITGKVSLVIHIEELNGTSNEKNLEYQVTELPVEQFNLSVNGSGKNINLNTESEFSFQPMKSGYSGKYYAEISAPVCKDLKINNVPYSPGQRVEVNGTTNSVKFKSNTTGDITISLKVFDDKNNSAQGNATFTCTEPELELTLFPGETNLSISKPGNFIFTPRKGGETLSYELSVSPVNAGKFIIKDKEYNGKTEVLSGNAVNVTYIPLVAGTAEVVVSVTDQSGKRKEKNILFEVFTTEVKISGIDAWNDGNKKIKVSERTGIVISANSPVQCHITDKDNFPVTEGVEFYIDGVKKENNTFNIGSSEVKLDVIPQKFGSHQYKLHAGDKEYPLNFFAVYNYTTRKIPFFLTFEKDKKDNIDRQILVKNPLETAFYRLNNGTYWYLDSVLHNNKSGVVSSIAMPTELLLSATENKVEVKIGEIDVPVFPDNSDIECNYYVFCNILQYSKNYPGQVYFDVVSGSETEQTEYTENTAAFGQNITLSKLNKVTGLKLRRILTINTLKPVGLSLTTYTSSPLKVNEKSMIGRFEIKDNEEYYNPEYDCSITISPSNAGTVEILRTNLQGSKKITVSQDGKFIFEGSKGNSGNIYFTPAISGTINVKLTVKDKNGNVTEKDCTCTVEEDKTEISVPANFTMEREQSNNANYIFNCTFDYYDYRNSQNHFGNVNLTLAANNPVNKLTQKIGDMKAYKKIMEDGSGTFALLGCGIYKSLIEYAFYYPRPSQKLTLEFTVKSKEGEVLYNAPLQEQNVTGGGYWIIGGSLWHDITVPWNKIEGSYIEISYKIKDIS